MKRMFIFSSVFLLFASFALQAQIVKSVALKVGPSWATQKITANGSTNNDVKYITGLHFALNAEFFNNPYVSMLAEIGYTQKGNKQDVEVTTPQMPDGSGETKTYLTRFNYAYFAPMFKLRKEFGDFVPYVFIGPRLDYQLSYTSDFDLSAVDQDFDKWLVGMNYGLGLEYMFGQIGVAAVFHQQLDFYYVYETNGLLGDNNFMNNAFVLDLAIKYYFGKK